MKSIALSTGHSEYDCGAISPIDNTKEYTLNKRLVAKLLTKHPVNARWKLIDEDAEYLKYPDHLYRTVKNINRSDCSVCLEVHHNASINPKIKGGMVIYWDYSKQGRVLADCLNKLMQLIPQYKIAESLTGFVGFCIYWEYYQFRHYKSRAIKTLKHIRRRLYYLRKTKIPAVIIEPGYISNAEDLKFVQVMMPDIANAIRKGMELYFSI